MRSRGDVRSPPLVGEPRKQQRRALRADTRHELAADGHDDLGVTVAHNVVQWSVDAIEHAIDVARAERIPRRGKKLPCFHEGAMVEGRRRS